LARPDAILCSNTSVIPITSIAARVEDKAVCSHAFLESAASRASGGNRADERGEPARSKTVEALLRSIGRHPVLVNRDIPGFIGNRLQHALKREAIALVAAGVCDAETIDDVVKLGFGARLAVLGHWNSPIWSARSHQGDP